MREIYFELAGRTVRAALALLAAAWMVPAAHAYEETFRLYHGIRAYVDNPSGDAFQLDLDLRDLNLIADGPREVLLKVYDPQRKAVVREIIPDGGVASVSYLPRVGGWDHELQYYALSCARLQDPMIRFSAHSDPDRLANVVKGSFSHKIAGGLKGLYRIVLVGERDHYATVRIDRDVKVDVCGHHTFLQGSGTQWRQSYAYAPKGSTGLFIAFAEPDLPRKRRLKIKAPDGEVLFDARAAGIFTQAKVTFDPPGRYDDEVLEISAAQGAGDFLARITLTRAT